MSSEAVIVDPVLLVRISRLYLGRSVQQHFERGSANPVTYVNA